MKKAAPRLGRKRDPTRDAAILDAALNVLAEVGYSGMTMDMVADHAKAGKATLYRRWPSKAELVTEAVMRLKSKAVNLLRLPDTGSLRGDLLALYKPQSVEDGARTLQVMAGLVSMIAHDKKFAHAVADTMMTPWVDAHRALMRRAMDREEIPADANVEILSQVAASIAGFRTLIECKPFTRQFLVSLIDVVVLPALGVKRQGRS
ncbi:MAG: TetR/AcrR family transcriptional regulator [Myxococcaceae bacterium]